LLLTCKWYEIIYFVHSENLQEILWITFIKIHLQIYSKLLKFIKSITQSSYNLFIFIFNLSQWHATSNQLSHEQLICLEALLANIFSLFLLMFQLNLKMSLFHETSTWINNFINELLISQTKSSRCWLS